MNDMLAFSDRAAFRAWLDKNGTSSNGVWILFGKKDGPVTLTAGEALEEALCFGWIDGQMKSIEIKRIKNTSLSAGQTANGQREIRHY